MNNQSNAATAAQAPSLVKVDAASTFSEVFSPGETAIKVFNQRSERCIDANTKFVPNESLVRMFLGWQQAPKQPLCFGLHGHTGTGKTEFLLWVADRMNIPVYLVQCQPTLMPEDLEGFNQLKNGCTSFELGAALQAYRDGGLLILDELDKLNEASGAYLHGLLEGKPITVAQTGETITKHPHCWIAATGNTKGQGGDEDYTSSQQMDMALRSRIGWLQVDYPEPATEMSILDKHFGKLLPKKMLREVIKVANDLRDAKFGKDRKGTDTPVGVICSTRSLVNWMFYTIRFGKKQQWRASFNYALGGSIDPESEAEVQAIVQRRLGEALDVKVEDVIKAFSIKK
ncbi:AAA family ATPase [Aliidiomarina quisquiliarum]|uniref:AAA family ATPase n=1 Tax=Aliidiomarina quisquiliarum TaxID=2938947 RepID=UPI00208FEC88|nr:MoxR family ATPase [Aliidiomarina quisquiliarum]MCO4320010.1 MoxR family ATPase [Aliidiomarina quisquiliarum]